MTSSCLLLLLLLPPLPPPPLYLFPSPSVNLNESINEHRRRRKRGACFLACSSAVQHFQHNRAQSPTCSDCSDAVTHRLAHFLFKEGWIRELVLARLCSADVACCFLSLTTWWWCFLSLVDISLSLSLFFCTVLYSSSVSTSTLYLTELLWHQLRGAFCS